MGTCSLDINESDRGIEPMAGGTCANIMSHLAWMGYRSIIMCSIGRDEIGRLVRRDLELRGVRCFAWDCDGQHAIRTLVKDGTHSFDRRCVHGIKMPPFTPLPMRFIDTLKLPCPDVFVFDRATPSALRAAKEHSRNGTLVFFEPVSRGTHGLYEECADASTIIKRCSSQEELTVPPDRIGIITDGKNGLTLLHDGTEERLPAVKPVFMRDPCGCGDCVSAGIIDGLLSGEGSLAGHAKAGQALAALNCSYTGAWNMVMSTTAEYRYDVMRTGVISEVPPEVPPEVHSIQLCRCQ